MGIKLLEVGVLTQDSVLIVLTAERSSDSLLSWLTKTQIHSGLLLTMDHNGLRWQEKKIFLIQKKKLKDVGWQKG